jgi:stringent starvation protein A
MIRSLKEASVLTLLENPVSSYTRNLKVKILPRDKGVPSTPEVFTPRVFTSEVPHDLGSGRSGGEFKAAKPRIEVPLLIDGAARIFDSPVIMDYIEERWPDPALLPCDPAARHTSASPSVCATRTTRW